MASLHRGCALGLLLAAAATTGALAQGPAAAPGLYDRPVLVVDPGLHTAGLARADADAEGRWAVTGSDDKTVRVWSLADGALLRTLRLPAGPGQVGRAYAVAISPDGALIAVGGWTRWREADRQEQIYLYDRASGALVRRIERLPNVVTHLTFALDGSRLAAVLGGGEGLRVYDRAQGWDEVARDAAYGDHSYGAAFAPDGRLVTTAYDGKVRLYAGDLRGTVRPRAVITAPGGRYPFGIAFNSDGQRIAVGYDYSPTVSLLDGGNLAPLPGPDLAGIAGGSLSSVAWSRDNRAVFAAGRYQTNGGTSVLAWSEAGAGARRSLPTGRLTVMSLMVLSAGDLLVAAADPWLSRLPQEGSPRWTQPPPQADFRGQHSTLAVSADGTRVDFSYEAFGQAPARFDLTTRTLTINPPPDRAIARPRQDGLPLADWINKTRPTLAGQPLLLERYEMSRSLAIHPVGDRFVLGTGRGLRAFNAQGRPLWHRPVPGEVWAVAISGDGRLVIAAQNNGTLRWHRMSDGVELLALMPLADRRNWVAWTPEGYYAATSEAQGVLRWHTNRGWDAPAEAVPASDISGSYRPEVLPLVLQELETPRALGLAVEAEHRREIQIRTQSQVPPGAQLHLLTIGISTYNPTYASRLRLNYADQDAGDLASALINTQGSLYAQVNPQVLQNGDATKVRILEALGAMRENMSHGTGNDLAVLHFSGHGALLDGKLYLLPYDINLRPAGIKAYGLSIEEVRGELLELAKHGRVLVLLDACHSGATSMDGASLAMDATALRSGLAATNVTVLTSSSGRQVSREDPSWQHGAFTKVLLDALTDPAADIDRKGLISTTGLANYVNSRVAALTNGAQTPEMELRFNTTVFATGR